MTKKVFEELIFTLQSLSYNRDKAHKLGIDLIDFAEPYYKAINLLLKRCFNQEQIDWIDWYLYEREMISSNKLKAWKTNNDGTEQEICHTIDSLWKTIQECA
jgi:hypothetical protein